MSAVSVQTDSVVDESVDRTTFFSQTVLDSSSIIAELPDNSEQYFLLDMSNWQRDSTKFGIVFTGPNGETFLPLNSFARLDSYVNELMQSEYLYLTKNYFTLIQKTEFTVFTIQGRILTIRKIILAKTRIQKQRKFS